MINQQLADREHLRPGGTLHLIGYPQRGPSPDIAHAERLALRVSAIVVFDDQIVSAAGERPQPWLLLSQAFARTRQAASFNPAGGGASVLLRPGAGAAAFARGATALAARYRVGKADVINLATGHAAAQRAIRPQAAALAVFAALAGLIALAIIGQLLSRQLVLDSAEFPVLRALGMTRSRLTVLSLARVAIITTAGAAAAVGVAIAASPLMPIGPARAAEPSPGVEVNLAILGAGFAVIAAAPLLAVAPAAVRAAARAQGSLGLAGSVPGSLGVRMAFEPGHGRTAVPVRSALVGTGRREYTRHYRCERARGTLKRSPHARHPLAAQDHRVIGVPVPRPASVPDRYLAVPHRQPRARSAPARRRRTRWADRVIVADVMWIPQGCMCIHPEQGGRRGPRLSLGLVRCPFGRRCPVRVVTGCCTGPAKAAA